MSIDRPDNKALHDFSTSRLSVASKCGLAFRYKYVDKLPAPYESAAAMFGNVLHDGLAEWYGVGPTTEDNVNRHKESSLVEICKQQWPRLLPPKVWDSVRGMVELDMELDALAELVVMTHKKKDLKAPRQTKAFKESGAYKRFEEGKGAMLELCESSAEVKWPKDEDPFKAYIKSIQVAARLENEWKILPRPLLVEEPFRLELEEWTIYGRIDQVRQDPNLDTGERGEPVIIDTKTSKQPLSQEEAFVQAYLYYEAVKAMDHCPTTTKIAFSLLRHHDERGRTKTQRGKIDPASHRELALQILHGKTRQVLTAQFEPSFGSWCRFCDFRDLCDKRIHLWEGDGIIQGTET